MKNEKNDQLQQCLTKTAKDNGAILVGYTYINKLHSTAIVLGFHYSDTSYFKSTVGITKRIYQNNKLSQGVLSKLNLILAKESYTYYNKGILSVYGDMRPFIKGAGLGVFGRNGLIVNQQYGSNLLFSMLFTSAPLRTKEAGNCSHHPCTDCKRCIDACPVNAFENNKFNTYKCFISSLKGCKECVTHCINANGIVYN